MNNRTNDQALKDKKERKLTIFTPTYNRAACLQRLYESLRKQTDKRFLWLVVDDGSEDETASLLERWQNESEFIIRWVHTENKGKHQAHNLAVENADTELFFCVDSDDLLYPDTVEAVLSHWDQYGKESLAGIIGYKADLKGIYPGRFFTERPASLRDFYRFGLIGDAALIYRTALLKQHPFPTFAGETFVTENTVYAQIDEDYPLLPLVKPLVKGDYLPDGYTNNALRLLRDNPKGWAFYHRRKAEYAVSFWERIYHLSQSTAYDILAGQRDHRKKDFRRLYRIIASPLGWMLSKKRLMQYRRYEKKERKG